LALPTRAAMDLSRRDGFRQTRGMTVIELRQYTLLPGRRDELIELFEAQFVESQRRCGIDLIGTFRDLGDAQRFVWIRGFPDMAARKDSLGDFYFGPEWRRSRDAANATMIDSDNVLLLRPAWNAPHHGASQEPLPAADDRGIVQAGIVSLRSAADQDDLVHFCGVLKPAVEAGGGTVLACLVSEHAENTFPALPVREGENVLVWLASFPMQPEHPAPGAVEPGLCNALQSWPGGAVETDVRLLDPTPRSQLTGHVRTRLMPLCPTSQEGARR
jgi:hypothetical protein